MEHFKEMVEWRTDSGEAITAGDLTVIPQARTLVVRWPYGGWVWQRPAAVQVRGQDRPEAPMPIVDVTRLAQLALWGLALIFSMATFFLTIRQRRN